MQPLTNNLGHWSIYGNLPKDFEVKDYFGFVYIIKNNHTEQYYIGKKQFQHHGSKKSRHYGREMNWRNYTGSSAALNADIKKYGKDNFKFLMIDLYKTKGGMYYAEAYLQMILGCMTEYLSDKQTPRFYNRQIAAIRFVPKEPPTAKTLKFINSFKRGM